MIYSGVDLIRRSDQTQARAEKFAGPKPVTAVGSAHPQPQKDPDPQGALLRFARFINKERKKKPDSKPTSNNPYLLYRRRLLQVEDRGQILNIYI